VPRQARCSFAGQNFGLALPYDTSADRKRDRIRNAAQRARRTDRDQRILRLPQAGLPRSGPVSPEFSRTGGITVDVIPQRSRREDGTQGRVTRVAASERFLAEEFSRIKRERLLGHR